MTDGPDTADPERALRAEMRDQGRVLITGASGFIGSSLTRDLAGSMRVRAACREPAPSQQDAISVGALGPKTDWRAALDGVDMVVHLAGPAHARYPAEVLQRTIVDAAAALAEQAAEAGVKRFVYVSSIHACAKRTTGAPLTELTPPHPEDGYGAAKLAAETIVLSRPELHPVILRPPLVVGPKATGNLARLLRLLDTPMPLPFAGVRNKRSLISLLSLNAAITAVLRAPLSSARGVFHVCDDPAVSISEMAALLRQGLGRPGRFFAAPGFATLAPRALTEDLEVDSSRFRTAFGFAGADTREALVRCGRAWKAS